VLDIDSSFGGQYLYVEAARARNGHHGGATAADLAPLVAGFGRTYAEKVDAWSARLRELLDGGRRAAVWGAGSKGVTFLNLVERGRDISAVIDLNPRKHGRFVPGTGQEIAAPESLVDSGVDVVLAMNRLYVDEIRRSLEDLGVRADVLVV
jgi:hypothetical protein